MRKGCRHPSRVATTCNFPCSSPPAMGEMITSKLHQNVHSAVTVILHTKCVSFVDDSHSNCSISPNLKDFTSPACI